VNNSRVERLSNRHKEEKDAPTYNDKPEKEGENKSWANQVFSNIFGGGDSKMEERAKVTKAPNPLYPAYTQGVNQVTAKKVDAQDLAIKRK
jgi:hypothetical protein